MGETIIIDRNGKEVPVLQTINSHQNRHGTNFFVSSTLKDLSEQKGRERLLQKEKELAIRETEVKSRFLSNMSHEIRTPLGGILGMAQILKDEGFSNKSRAYDRIDTILNTGESLLTIINDILDFSKIEAGLLSVDLHVFSIRKIIEDVRDLMRPLATRKSLELRIDIAPEIPDFIKSDSTRIRQVLSNLVTNAIKFSPKGKVEIILRIISKHNQEYINLKVADTGIGIAESGIEKLFKPFSQVDASDTRNFGGTGLGLSICKGIVEALDGYIDVDSELGKGTTFSVLIPLIEAKNETTELTEKVHSDHFEGSLVLVAEDNAVNQEVILAILSQLGIRVDLAENGREACKASKEKNYDLIFMDCHMPVMDGLTATLEITRALGEKCPPIVALTAGVTAHEKQRCFDHGMNHVLAKPIRRKLLQDTLRTYLKTDSSSRKVG